MIYSEVLYTNYKVQKQCKDGQQADSNLKHVSTIPVSMIRNENTFPPPFSTLCIIYLKTCRLFISFQCWFHEGFFLYNVNLSRQFYTHRSNFLVLRHEIYLWIILLSTEVGGACRIFFFTTISLWSMLLSISAFMWTVHTSQINEIINRWHCIQIRVNLNGVTGNASPFKFVEEKI